MSGKLSDELYTKFHESMPIFCVDIVLKNSEGGFLLVKRSNEPANGQWWLPGGRLLRNETIDEAAVRKIKEEVGLDIKLFKGMNKCYELIFNDSPFSHGRGTHNVTTCVSAEVSDFDDFKLDGNHSELKLFHKVDEDWHPYVKECLREAGIR